MPPIQNTMKRILSNIQPSAGACWLFYLTIKNKAKQLRTKTTEAPNLKQYSHGDPSFIRER